MAIVQNVPCPSCQEVGHDHSGDHMMVFDDGGRYCNRAHFHKSGKPLYVAPDGEDPVLKSEITGEIKYTPEQFRTLAEDGKLDNPVIRDIALRGMRQKDAFEVMTEKEKAEVLEDWSRDIDYFKTLKFKNLTTRNIKGPIAKFYGVRVGVDELGRTNRHYYPRYSMLGELEGAKCRFLPKSFGVGTLGKVWGEQLLFGQQTLDAVLKEGRGFQCLTLTGGEEDAMAAQQMLLSAAANDQKWAGKHHHIWSVGNGESCIEDILRHKEILMKFNVIKLAFDDDETGQKLSRQVFKLLRGKCVRVGMPTGCKDANQALNEGKGDEFVAAWFKPIDVMSGHGKIKRIKHLSEAAKKMPVMGVGWPFPELDWLTFGIQEYGMTVLGAGTGVGKTKTTKQIVHHLTEGYDEDVAVIYLEEHVEKTVRNFAGMLINKALDQPPMTDPSLPEYEKQYDYTQEQADAAIDELARRDRVVVVDLKGEKGIDSVMEALEEVVASGIKYIVLDNLTAIELPGNQNKVQAIDEAMKRLGTFKDSNPIHIFLLSHLTRPQQPRVPHELGGPVYINDFRGAGSITFWANTVIGIERNTEGETEEEKRLTTYRIVKCRDRGISVGRFVRATMNPDTGMLVQVGRCTPAPSDEESNALDKSPPEDNEEF